MTVGGRALRWPAAASLLVLSCCSPVPASAAAAQARPITTDYFFDLDKAVHQRCGVPGDAWAAAIPKNLTNELAEHYAKQFPAKGLCLCFR